MDASNSSEFMSALELEAGYLGAPTTLQYAAALAAEAEFTRSGRLLAYESADVGAHDVDYTASPLPMYPQLAVSPSYSACQLFPVHALLYSLAAKRAAEALCAQTSTAAQTQPSTVSNTHSFEMVRLEPVTSANGIIESAGMKRNMAAAQFAAGNENLSSAPPPGKRPAVGVGQQPSYQPVSKAGAVPVNAPFKPPMRVTQPAAAAPPPEPAAAPASAFRSGTDVHREQLIAQGKDPGPPRVAVPQQQNKAGLMARAGQGLRNGGGAGPAGAAEDPALAQARIEAAVKAFGGPSIVQKYRGDDGYTPVLPLPDHLKAVSLDACKKMEDEAFHGDTIDWSDIAGLEHVKGVLMDAIQTPLRAAHLQTGIMKATKAVLLFGPPGTGKTLLARAAASQCGARFFSISASSITSKWIGEAEMNIRALFATALEHAPSIIFIDEIDSILTVRGDKMEDQSSGKIKTEFLVQFDGANTSKDTARPVLLVGATNRPDTLDEAARRRFHRRILIPLPDPISRREAILLALRKHSGCGYRVSIAQEEIEDLVDGTDGFSQADIAQMMSKSAQIAFDKTRLELLRGSGEWPVDGTTGLPVHEKAVPSLLLSRVDVTHIGPQQVQPLTAQLIAQAAHETGSSVGAQDIVRHDAFNKEYGTDKPVLAVGSGTGTATGAGDVHMEDAPIDYLAMMRQKKAQI